MLCEQWRRRVVTDEQCGSSVAAGGFVEILGDAVGGVSQRGGAPGTRSVMWLKIISVQPSMSKMR